MTDRSTDNDRQSQPSKGDQAPRTIDSAELLQGAREVVIRHGKETYRLRLTRQGKLILHK